MKKSEAARKAEQVRQEIERAQEQLRQLEEILNAPEGAPSLLVKPEIAGGKTYWALETNAFGEFQVGRRSAASEEKKYYWHGNIFMDEEQAGSYAEALDTLLLLRHQPGTQPATRDTQFQLEVVGEGGRLCMRAYERTVREAKMQKLSPCFNTGEDAAAAISAVGEGRVLRMMQTLHGIE